MYDDYLSLFLLDCILARPCIIELESWVADQMLDTGCSEHAANTQRFVYQNYQLMNFQLH